MLEPNDKLIAAVLAAGAIAATGDEKYLDPEKAISLYEIFKLKLNKRNENCSLPMQEQPQNDSPTAGGM